ncbi:MAG TPA: DUF2079 domain-containing protein [Polyangia bacterium]|jgi:uncharacterized membrane protein|nr:DUF2079 domain-containing protein [Polyangia bacterium]
MGDPVADNPMPELPPSTESPMSSPPAEEPAATATTPAPKAPAHDGVPALTGLTRSLGLLGLEGWSVGLLAWGARAAWRLSAYAVANEITAKGRIVLLADMFGTAFAVCLLAVVYMLVRRRRADVLDVVDGVARRLAPLVVVGLLPFLLNWSIWSGRELSFLVLAAVFTLGVRPLLTMSLSAPPLLGQSLTLIGLGVALHAFRHRHARFFARLPLFIVLGGAVYYAAFFAYHTIVHHRNILSTSLDLGLEDNLVWNALHGGPLFKSSPYSGPTGSHGGNHVTFFAYVIALFYFFAQRAETLLVLQAVVLGAAAIPLFLFARRHIGPWKACVVALCYLLYPPLHGSNLYDFHYLPLGTFFLWLTLYALESRRTVLSVFAVILTLSVREDVAAGLGIIGGLLLLTGERPKAGIIVAIVGVGYAGLLKLVIMPHVAGAWSFLSMYQGLVPSGENSYGAMLKTVVGNPAFTVNSLVERDKLLYLLQILVPLAFIPLSRPLTILCCVPGFIFTLLSTGYAPLYQISFQYTAHWTTYLFIAVVLAVEGIDRRAPNDQRAVDPQASVRQRAAMVTLALASLVASHQYGALIQQNTVRGGFGVYQFGTSAADRARREALYALIARLPPRAKVAGTETVVPQISHRPDAYTARIGIFDADYLLFMMPAGGEEGRNIAAGLASSGYGVVEVKEPFALAKKGYSTAANASVLTRVRGY